jgi:hypothetical protein
VANPVSSVSSALQTSKIAEQSQVRDAAPSRKTPVIPQDTVSISQSGKAASQAVAASKSVQPSSSESESGESK